MFSYSSGHADQTAQDKFSNGMNIIVGSLHIICWDASPMLPMSLNLCVRGSYTKQFGL